MPDIASTIPTELPQGHCFIYALADPLDPGTIRYVGKTVKPLHRRLAEHVADRNRANRFCHRMAWIRKLVREGRKPVIRALEICSDTVWVEREQHWIKQFKVSGRLINGTDGGEGGSGNSGWKWSKEALSKVSKARRERAAQWKKEHPGQCCPNAENLRKGWNRPRKPKVVRPRRTRRMKQLKLKIHPRKTVEQKAHMRQVMLGRKITWVTRRSAENKAITAPLLRECNVHRQKPVVSDDNRRFASIAEACRLLKVSGFAFREAVKHHWRCRGAYWTILEPVRESESLCQLA